MLTQYNICGEVKVNKEQVVAEYIIRNLNTGFTSINYNSTKGFYNINLANFPNKKFEEGDVISIEFTYIDNNNITYFTRICTIINNNSTTTNINAILEKNWDYSSQIKISDVNPGTVNVDFLTTKYKNILFKLYYKYNGKYKELDSVLIDKQSVRLQFPYSGEFMLAGYVLFGGVLLSYTQKEFNITNVTNNIITNSRYIEWE